MNDHITTQRMNEFCSRTLDVKEMGGTAEHLAVCASCWLLYDQVFDRRRDYEPVVVNLSQDWLKHEHLDYEQLVPYVDDRLDATEREMADIHLKLCEECREAVRSFRKYRQQIEPEMSVRYGPDNQSSLLDKFLSKWNFTKVNRKLIYAASIMLIIASAAILTTILLRPDRANNQQASKQISLPPPANTDPAQFDSSSETQQQGNSGSDIARAPVDLPVNRQAADTNSSKSKTSRPRTIRENANTNRARIPEEALMSLNNGAGKVTLNKSGNLTGLGDVSPDTRQAIKEVLLAQNIQRPQVITELIGEGGTLRGAAETTAPFKLLSPERNVLAEDRPIFKWQPLKEATSYQVHVVDSNNHEVTRSSELPTATTQWMTPTPLKRGVVFTWIVTAIVNKEQVISPGASAPEMKFKVLEEEKVAEINRLKRLNSHLALGVFYARVGMIKDAEREFELLFDENPQSPIAMKLLRSIQSWK